MKQISSPLFPFISFVSFNPNDERINLNKRLDEIKPRKVKNNDEFKSRRFDHKTTEFSPAGRIHQLENAMEAISKGGSGIATLYKDGIILAAERRITSKLIDFKTESDKICVIAGLQADANTLIDYSRKEAQNYRKRYQEPIPLEQLVQSLCDLKHSYTQFGGYRPFGVSFLLGGWDECLGFQLYETDPSGNYSGCQAAAIGAKSAAAVGIFQKHLEDNQISVSELPKKNAQMLSMKAICKALEVSDPPTERLEFAKITRKGGKIRFKVLKREEVEEFVKKAKIEIDFGEEKD